MRLPLGWAVVSGFRGRWGLRLLEKKGNVSIPQGFSDSQFKKFARGVRQFRRLAGLPKGDLVIQGRPSQRASKT